MVKAARLRAHLGAKIRVWLGLAVGICVPYFTLQRVSIFPTRQVPQTALDAAVGFAPEWIWAYASLALLVPLAPLLAAQRDDLIRYVRGLVLLCSVCFAVFLLLPVEGPRPLVPPDHAVYRAIIGLDRPSNSFPSLHAGLTTYSLLFAAHALRGSLARRAARVAAGLGILWGALILFATLATKQHWAMDLPAGALVAVWAHWRAAGPRRPGGI